jgi:hypothetical protein
MPARILAATDRPQPGTLEAIFHGLSDASEHLIGAARPHLLVIPIHDDVDGPRGGLWGWTMFAWLTISKLFVSARLRGRDCRGIHRSACSFQAAPFNEKHGYSRFAVLEDMPPGHARIHHQKPLISQNKRVTP